MKTSIFIAIAFAPLAIAIQAGETRGTKAMIVEHVQNDGHVDAELAEATGWNSLQGVSYQMLLVDERTGKASPTATEPEFLTKQAFKLSIEAHTDLWIYVMNVEPSGKMITLLPELGEQHMLVKAGKTVMVPPDGNFRFVGEPGVEQFRIVASPVKLQWINPESLWKLENGESLRPDEERVALAASAARSKSIAGIQSSQEKRQKASGGLYAKSLTEVVQTLEKNPDMRAMVKDVVLLPPPSEVGDAPDDSHRHDAILVSQEAASDGAIVLDIKLKHR